MAKPEPELLNAVAIAEGEELLIDADVLNNAHLQALIEANEAGCELRIMDPGKRFAGTITDQRRKHAVMLLYSPLSGWDSACTCDDEDEGFCVHSYALLSILLDFAIAQAVPTPPATTPPATPPGLPPPAPTPTPTPAPTAVQGALVNRIAARLDRPLKPYETQLLARLESLHRLLHQGHYFAISQLAGLKVDYSSQKLDDWADLRTLAPADSADPLIWWGNLVVALLPHDVEMPELLLTIADLPAAKLRMQQWQRNQEVQRWHRTLQSAAKACALDRHHTPIPVADLRLSIRAPSTICLEGLNTDTHVYRPLTGKLIKRLHEEGLPATWPPEAMLLWSIYTQHWMFSGYNDATKRIMDPGTPRVLVDVLRHPSLNTRLVNERGEVLPRPEGKLRWEVTLATTQADDYALRLVTPEGQPLPPLVATLPAYPLNYYLTTTAIYQGPRLPAGKADLDAWQAIPAPALETAAGAHWLLALEAPLPPRLAERVRHEKIQVVIRCALQRPPASSEQCTFTLSAASTNGLWQANWVDRATGWRSVEQLHTPQSPQVAATTEPIQIYDQSALAVAMAFLDELEVRWAQEFKALATRVTKTFPERFAAWVRRAPPHVQLRLDGELASLTEVAIAGQVRLDVTEDGLDWFDLRVVVNVQDTTLTPAEIKLLLAAHGGFVRLPNKGWRRLTFALSPEEEESLARLGLNARDFDAEPQRLHALQLADGTARRMLPPEQAARVERRAEEIRLRTSPAVPAGITAQLRPYQLEGFHFLAYLCVNRFGGILADDMGLGKTLQALTWLTWLRAEAGKQPAPALIVCPKSVTDNWLAEATRFAPGLRVQVWRGGEAITGLATPAAADVHVINYNQLRLAEESVCHADWLAVVLDEGQYIKNPSSQVSQIARRLRARHRLVLTGTPIENQLLDLWSLFAFAMPGVLGTRAQFGRTFDAKGDPFSRRRLSARVRPFLLRRTKAQVAADLPPRVEEDLFCELEGTQLALYQAERKRAQQLLLRIETDKQLAEQRFHILVSLLRLRQICCHPALVQPDADPAESAKLDALLELLGPLMEEGHKVLVFSQFVEVLTLVRRALEARGWQHYLLTGETEERGELVQTFKACEGAAVFLISLRAGGFGLNLAEASYVVLFDPWWNPAVENQAIDRTHRIGQTRTVNAYRLLVKGTVEEKIRLLQRQKGSLAEDVLGEERFAQALTLNDLQFLFDS